MEFVLKEEMEEYGSFNHEKILLVDDNDTNIFVVTNKKVCYNKNTA